jgi:hypothetical protein
MNRSKLFALFFSTVFVALIVVSVNAETRTVSVPPERGVGVTVINLNQGDKVTGEFSVYAEFDAIVQFWVEDPDSNVVVEARDVTEGSTFEVNAEKTGNYTLVFENWNDHWEKVVTVSYDINASGNASALFSNPLAWIAVVIIIVLAAIAALIIRAH